MVLALLRRPHRRRRRHRRRRHRRLSLSEQKCQQAFLKKASIFPFVYIFLFRVYKIKNGKETLKKYQRKKGGGFDL
jgi:hypothetical protein